jgi:hypothetical protein
MADIVGGVVNHVDMGKADNANDEQAEAHCENGLKNDAQVVCGDWQMSGVGHEELQSLILVERGLSCDHYFFISRATSRLVR